MLWTPWATLVGTSVLDAFRRWSYLEAQLDPVPDAPHLLGLDRRRVHAHRRPQGAPRRAAARGRRAAAQHAPGIDVEPLLWEFLTGSRDAIHSLSREGFKLGLSDAAEEDGGPVHTTRFVLVDCRGAIRGYYDALTPDSVTKLLADTNHLLREQPK